MISINLADKRERRAGFDRRQYEYNSHIPERRSLEKRRVKQKDPSEDKTDDGSGSDKSKRE